jgi:hypothetical protein
LASFPANEGREDGRGGDIEGRKEVKEGRKTGSEVRK